MGRMDESSGRAANAIRTLRSQGERVTAARRAVVSAVAATDEHLTADEIAERAATGAPGVHRTTVYRALATLEDIGLIAHTHRAGSATIYHLTVDHEGTDHLDHAHVECSNCGRLIDFDATLADPLAANLKRSLGFRLDVHHAALLGVCASCQEIS